MPIITLKIFPGRTAKQKRELAAAYAKETARIIGCPQESVITVIEETEKENWAFGAELALDKHPDA